MASIMKENNPEKNGADSSEDDSDYDPNKPNSSDDEGNEDDSDLDDDECLGDDEYKSEIDSDDDVPMSSMVDVVNNFIAGHTAESNNDNAENDNQEDEAMTLDGLELENYRIWKKNCPSLYDLLITSTLEWPSMTVQWCYSKQTKTNPSNYREHYSERVVLGTQVDENHSNQLIVATQHVPIMDRNQMAPCEGGVSHTKYAKLEYHVRMVHDGDVNRARYNPKNEFIIATSSANGKNYIFDYTKHPSEPAEKESKPELILEHHKDEGYGLCWNNRKSNILATGSEDETICVWDINSNPKRPKHLEPVNSFKAHEGSVNDVKWHYYHDSYLGSVGNDKMLKFWDLRMNRDMKSAFSCRAHEDNINTLSFNRFCEYIILTASDDRTVGLFDIRNLKHRLHCFEAHLDEVLDVHWSPYCETVFASSSRDRRLIIWDMTKINATQTDEEAEEGPPEMIFIHGGHTNVIQDFCWHPHNQLIASVSANNELHVFKPSIDIKLSI